MKRTFAALAIACWTALSVGCSHPPASVPENSSSHAEAPTDGADTTGEDDAEIKAALADLPEADRAEAEAQRFCAVEPENRLGSMGKQFKVVLDGQSVFLCCAGCEDAAKADPAKTLAQAEKLKAAE